MNAFLALEGHSFSGDSASYMQNSICSFKNKIIPKFLLSFHEHLFHNYQVKQWKKVNPIKPMCASTHPLPLYPGLLYARSCVRSGDLNNSKHPLSLGAVKFLRWEECSRPITEHWAGSAEHLRDDLRLIGTLPISCVSSLPNKYDWGNPNNWYCIWQWLVFFLKMNL